MVKQIRSEFDATGRFQGVTFRQIPCEPNARHQKVPLRPQSWFRIPCFANALQGRGAQVSPRISFLKCDRGSRKGYPFILLTTHPLSPLILLSAWWFCFPSPTTAWKLSKENSTPRFCWMPSRKLETWKSKSLCPSLRWECENGFNKVCHGFNRARIWWWSTRFFYKHTLFFSAQPRVAHREAIFEPQVLKRVLNKSKSICKWNNKKGNVKFTIKIGNVYDLRENIEMYFNF